MQKISIGKGIEAIIGTLSVKDLTSLEIAEAMLKVIEHQYKAGPIIGETRQPLLDMLWQIWHRDQIVSAVTNWPHADYVSVLTKTAQQIQEKDQKIIAAREAAKNNAPPHAGQGA